MSQEKTEPVQTEQKPEKKKKLTKVEKWFRFMRRCYYTWGRILIPIKKLGHKERFSDPYIYVGNHLSVLDVIPIAASLDKPVHFLAKKEIAEKRIGKWFTEKCECIMVNRDGSDVRAVMLAMKYLKNGESVCIFPEGTRNKTDEVFLPFKSGAAALAIRTKTPIVMVVQCKKIRFFRRNYFYYSEPFEFTDYYGKKPTEDDYKEADEKLREKMLELHCQLVETLKNKKKKKK